MPNQTPNSSRSNSLFCTEAIGEMREKKEVGLDIINIFLSDFGYAIFRLSVSRYVRIVLQFRFHVVIFYDESGNNFMLAILWIMVRATLFPRISSDILHNIGIAQKRKK